MTDTQFFSLTECTLYAKKINQLSIKLKQHHNMVAVYETVVRIRCVLRPYWSQ